MQKQVLIPKTESYINTVVIFSSNISRNNSFNEGSHSAPVFQRALPDVQGQPLHQ